MDEEQQAAQTSEPEAPAADPTSGERYSRRDLATLVMRLADEFDGAASVPALGGAFALLGKAEADIADIRDAVARFLNLPA